MSPQEFLQALRQTLGAEAVLSGDAVPARYHTDWSGTPPVAPLALVRPRSTEDVSATLRLCHQHRVPVVPQGGLTGLAGAAVPSADCVALSLERMPAIEAIDARSATMTVQAGPTLRYMQAAAAALAASAAVCAQAGAGPIPGTPGLGPLGDGLLTASELETLTASDGSLRAQLDAVTGTPAILAVDPAETAIVARVPVRAFVNPENRLMVYRKENTRQFAGPAFLLNQMLVWGFTAQVISAMLDVAGWAKPWNTDVVEELDAAMALLGESSGYRVDQP